MAASSSSCSIRRAKPEEIDRLVSYGRTFWHQTLYYEDGVDYDVPSVRSFTRFLLDQGLVLYAEKDGVLVGLMLVVIGPFPMNNNFSAATEWVFYVDPSVRKEGIAQKMILKTETLLREAGVKYLSLISLSNVEPEAAEGLYKSLGYRHTETSFTKDLG